MSDILRKTERMRLRRMRERGHFDRETIYAILDAMPMCHVGDVLDGSSGVIRIKMRFEEPQPDPRNLEGLATPGYVRNREIG